MNDHTYMNNDSGNLDIFYTELRQTYETIAQSDQPPVAQLGLFATRSLHLFEKHREWFDKNPGRMFSVITNNDQNWLTVSTQFFTEAITAAIHTGKMRNVDAQKAGTLLLNAIFALMIRRVHLTPYDTIEDDVRDLIDLFLNGLTTIKVPTPVAPT